jgi:hypothetical protein
MGNVAISFIEVGMTLNDAVTAKRQQTRERKRIMSLIPRYLRALRNFDTSITTLNLNRLGVDTHDLRLFSIPLISGHTRVTELYLEGNQIGVEGATAIAKIICSARYLKDVSLANNPGKFKKENMMMFVVSTLIGWDGQFSIVSLALFAYTISSLVFHSPSFYSTRSTYVSVVLFLVFISSFRTNDEQPSNTKQHSSTATNKPKQSEVWAS